MLVFRCECDTVLGVDNESTKGGLGECPSCGKIIRVPMGLVDAAGKLRLATPPARASGSYRLIKDVKPEGAKSGLGSGLSSAVPPQPAAPTHIPAPSHVPEPETMAEDLAEPETLAPLTDSSINRPVTDSAPLPAVEAEVAPDAPTETLSAPEVKSVAAQSDATSSETTIRTKDSLGKKPSKSTRIAAQADVNDPNAAVETRADRDLAATATTAAPTQGSSSRRRRPDVPSAAGKKSPVLLIAVVVGLAVVVALILWWAGFFGGEAPKSNNSVPKVPATKTDSTDKTSDTKSAATTDKPADAPKPPDANDQKAPADGDKKNDK